MKTYINNEEIKGIAIAGEEVLGVAKAGAEVYELPFVEVYVDEYFRIERKKGNLYITLFDIYPKVKIFNRFGRLWLDTENELPNNRILFVSGQKAGLIFVIIEYNNDNEMIRYRKNILY